MDMATLMGLVVIGFFLLIWLAALIKWFYGFMAKRSYIIRQLNRSDNDRNRQHWERKLHDFYLSNIPIVGKWLKDRRRR